MSYTLPSDVHAPGDSGHTNDHNSIVDVLKGMGAVSNVLNTAYGSGGADPTGVNIDSTAAIQAAVVNALPASGGITSTSPAGIYKVTSTITIPQAGVRLVGAGKWCTFIFYYGTGDCIRMYSSIGYGQGLFASGGGIEDLIIDRDARQLSAGACGAAHRRYLPAPGSTSAPGSSRAPDRRASGSTTSISGAKTCTVTSSWSRTPRT